jgi:flagellar basal body-associated protein FliL
MHCEHTLCVLLCTIIIIIIIVVVVVVVVVVIQLFLLIKTLAKEAAEINDTPYSTTFS